MSNNFSRDLRKAEQRILSEAKNSIIAIGQELFAELVRRHADGGAGGSPVASGRFTASMRVGINAIDHSVAPRDPSYRYPSAEVHRYNADNLPKRTLRGVPASRVASALRAFKLGDTIFISNSLPYGPGIERSGHSWQTREGVFETTVRIVAKKFKFARIRVLNG